MRNGLLAYGKAEVTMYLENSPHVQALKKGEDNDLFGLSKITRGSTWPPPFLYFFVRYYQKSVTSPCLQIYRKSPLDIVHTTHKHQVDKLNYYFR